MQTVMLLAVEAGLGTCPQALWARLTGTLRAMLPLPDGQLVVAGMALGRPDPAHPVNQWRSRRDPFDSFADMTGFERSAPR